MGVEELLDEEAFDPKKLFNEEEYSTLIIGREGLSKKENTTADLLEALLEPNITRQESEDIFLKLKEANAQKMMVDAIGAAEKTSEKTALAAACWESGLDFSDYFMDFVDLTLHNDFQLALEALSVIESSEGVQTEQTLTKALILAQSSKSKNPDLVNDLVQNLKSRIA